MVWIIFGSWELRNKYLVEVSIGQDGEVLFDGLQQPDRDVEASVRLVSQLRRMPYRPERPSRLRLHVECPGRVPSVSSWHQFTPKIKSNWTTLHIIEIFTNHSSKTRNNERGRYASRRMIGAQCFSAMRPRSFLLHFSTAFWYSSLTFGYDFPMAINRSAEISVISLDQIPARPNTRLCQQKFRIRVKQWLLRKPNYGSVKEIPQRMRERESLEGKKGSFLEKKVLARHRLGVGPSDLILVFTINGQDHPIMFGR